MCKCCLTSTCTCTVSPVIITTDYTYYSITVTITTTLTFWLSITITITGTCSWHRVILTVTYVCVLPFTITPYSDDQRMLQIVVSETKPGCLTLDNQAQVMYIIYMFLFSL